MNAIRQIADGLRLQRQGMTSWLPEHAEPIGDLLVRFGPEDENDCQYAFMVKWVKWEVAGKVVSMTADPCWAGARG